jgi:hypothetical protein
MTLLALAVTLGWWMIPLVLTVYFMYRMIDSVNNHSTGGYDFSGLAVIYWAVPILFTWLIYFICLAIF